MRIFIALELPGVFESQVAELSRQLSGVMEGRFMKRDTYHLTLAFLGDVREHDVSEAIDAIDAACIKCQPVLLYADGLGKFGRPSDAMLWLGVEKRPELIQLAECVREGLTERGISFDNKPFKPHITLARRAHIPKGGLPLLSFPENAYASTVTLFKSTLSREGASYKALHSSMLED